MAESILLAIVVAALAQGEPVSTWTADELADKLEAANVLANRGFETTFEERVVSAGPPEDEPVREARDWLRLETFRYVALGNRLYTLRTTYGRAEEAGAKPIVRYRQENIWANGAWVLRVSGQNAVTFYAQPGPTDLHGKGFIFNLMEERYPSSHRTLAELVRTGTVLHQSAEDGALRYRFATDTQPASRVQYTVRARIEPTFALLGSTVELSNSPTVEDFQAHVHLRQAYTVLDWQQVGDLRIPKRSHIESFGSANPQRAQGTRLSTRIIYTRQSFREIGENDIDPELFTVPLPVGTSVYDDRMKLSFEIGDTYLSLDGVVYELDEPIMEHPGERLGELIRQATPLQIPPPERPSASRPDAAGVSPTTESGRLRSPAGLAALVGAGVALLAAAVLRYRRCARN